MSDMNEILDSIYTLTQKRNMMADTYDCQIEKLKEILAVKMSDADTDHVEFNGAIAYYRKQTNVQVGNWNALMEYVKKNDAFDVLQRRVSPAQLEKRLNAGAHIDGVTVMHSEVLIVQGKKDAASRE